MTTASVTLPTPEIRSGDRSRKATFYIDPKPTADGDKARAVTLSVFHHKDSKCFTASLTPITIERRGAFTSEGFMVFSGARIARESVARYSEKAIDAFFEQVLASVPERVAGDERLAAMFTDHDEAAGRVL